MKNKRMTYVLGFVVIVVWGLIIQRLFAAAGGGDDDSTPTASNLPKKEPYNDFAITKDTTHLLLNYRDPFGLIKQKDTTRSVKKNYPISTVSIPEKPAFNWGFIQYDGYMRNPDSKKLITLVSINGKNEMLDEGEVKDQVKLIKNLVDSIKISFNGKTKFITMRHASL
ncbi:MAG TPA: hypothetical protein VGI43_16730 [Mucilaginibacter sp.]|jgi:hypothetical protein